MLKSNQIKESGIVSIMVTMVIMIVMTLIVVSFARISRREQRQALDRQLSSQAFYAAESGINAVQKYIDTNPSTNLNITNCGDAASVPEIAPALNLSDSVLVSCLLTSYPQTLEYKGIDGESRTIPVFSKDNIPIQSITIAWTSNGGGTDVSGCTSGFPQPTAGKLASNCDLPLLRVDLVPVAGAIDRASLLNNMFTSFLYPSGSGSSPTTVSFASASGTGSQGLVQSTRCSSGTCNMTIQNLNSTQYMMRIRALYGRANVTITPKDGSGNLMTLSGAQMMVDATGKARDVLKRIQVRLALYPDRNIQDFAVQTAETLCKRYDVITGAGGSVATSETDPACQIN